MVMDDVTANRAADPNKFWGEKKYNFVILSIKIRGVGKDGVVGWNKHKLNGKN